MRQSLKYLAVFLIGLASVSNLSAGNPDRVGSAGADQLLINPWVKSSAWGGANSASVMGLESLYGNVAGLAFVDKTELIFARTSWIADIPNLSSLFLYLRDNTELLRMLDERGVKTGHFHAPRRACKN